MRITNSSSGTRKIHRSFVAKNAPQDDKGELDSRGASLDQLIQAGLLLWREEAGFLTAASHRFGMTSLWLMPIDSMAV
jgi:hypothetical protein